MVRGWMPTKQAANDEVGPASVAEDGHCVTQKTIQRLHHPWCCP